MGLRKGNEAEGFVYLTIVFSNICLSSTLNEIIEKWMNK